MLELFGTVEKFVPALRTHVHTYTRSRKRIPLNSLFITYIKLTIFKMTDVYFVRKPTAERHRCSSRRIGKCLRLTRDGILILALAIMVLPVGKKKWRMRTRKIPFDTPGNSLRYTWNLCAWIEVYLKQSYALRAF